MNMKKTLLVLCALALIAGSVFGTLAYLTDSEAATNTFTVGKVGITLDEAKVTPGGKPVTPAARVQKNEYHLLPGQTYTKDPTIHVSDDSEGCYLFVKVENGIQDIETTDTSKTIAAQMKELHWKPIAEGSNIYIFAKEGNKYALYKGANVEVFKSFTIDGSTVDNTKLAAYKGKTVVVTAYAVQMAGFENNTPAEIWAAAFPNS